MHFPSASGAEITGNKITNIQPFKLPIKWKGGDFVFGSDGNISNNKIIGTGAWAIGTLSWKSFKGSGNKLEGNDFSGFTASSADFYCTGNKNVLIGPESKVVDKGEDNKILVKK